MTCLENDGNPVAVQLAGRGNEGYCRAHRALAYAWNRGMA